MDAAGGGGAFDFDVFVQVPMNLTNPNAMEVLCLHHQRTGKFYKVSRKVMRVLAKVAFNDFFANLPDGAKDARDIQFLTKQFASGDFTLLYWKYDKLRGLTFHLADYSWQLQISGEIVENAIAVGCLRSAAVDGSGDAFSFDVFVQVPTNSTMTGNPNAMESLLLCDQRTGVFHKIERRGMRILAKVAFNEFFDKLPEGAKNADNIQFLTKRFASGDFTLLYWKYDVVRGMTMHLADYSWQQPISAEIVRNAISNGVF